MRTSIKTLAILCDFINSKLETPQTPYSQIDGKIKANIGNFHLSQAYGGVCVHRMENDAGGVSTPIWYGHIPKKEAESLMRAYLRGLENQTA